MHGSWTSPFLKPACKLPEAEFFLWAIREKRVKFRHEALRSPVRSGCPRERPGFYPDRVASRHRHHRHFEHADHHHGFECLDRCPHRGGAAAAGHSAGRPECVGLRKFHRDKHPSKCAGNLQRGQHGAGAARPAHELPASGNLQPPDHLFVIEPDQERCDDQDRGLSSILLLGDDELSHRELVYQLL